jgi:hypothetical protein
LARSADLFNLADNPTFIKSAAKPTSRYSLIKQKADILWCSGKDVGEFTHLSLPG